MGAWGHKALDSDEGLDVVDFIVGYISESSGHVDLYLTDLVAKMKEDGFLGKTVDDIDFFYDNSAMALTELYFMFKEKGELDYDDEEENLNLRQRVKSFFGNKSSLEFLLKCLEDIKNEGPDKDGEREIGALWRDSDSYDDWQAHLDYLIIRLKEEIEH